MLAGIGVLANPVRADITTKFSSSVQLSVGGASTQAERIGSSFSISGSNIDTTDGTTAGTVSAGTITSGVYSPGTIAATQDTAGAAFSFAQSYTAGDAVGSAITIGSNPVLGKLTTTGVGTGTGTGTITSAHAITAVGGGSGTSPIGQFVSEITIN